MMKLNILKYILSICCVAFIFPTGYAKTYSNIGNDKLERDPAKKVRKKDDGSKKKAFRAGHYGFNAIDYVMQERYRYGDKLKYDNKGLLSHMYIGYSMGFDLIADRNEYTYKPGFTWGLTVGKELSKTHALSLMFRLTENTDKNTEAMFERKSLQLNHHFNFSRYYLGYNPFRKLEFLSSLGLGVQNGSIYDESYTAPFLFAGMQVALNLGNNAHLLIEPYAVIGGEGYNGAPKGYYYSKYNVSYGAMASFKYTLKNELTGSSEYAENYLFPRDYFFFESGLQSLNANLTILKTLGPSVSFGYGRWLSKRFAVQTALGWSAGAHDLYKRNNKPLFSKAQFLFGRAEGVVNLFTSFKDVADSRNGFSVNVSAGYEFGKLWRYATSLDNQTEAVYGGFTGAIRARYHVGEGKAIYLEPRVTWATYHDDYGHSYKDTERKYLMSRYNISLGMEYGSPYFNGVGRPEISDEFIPRTSVMLMVGPSYVANRGIYNGTPYSSYLSYSAAIGVEYQPFRLFGARLMYDFSRYGQNSSDYAGNKWLTDFQFNVNSAILDFKLDLTNLVYGYERSRRWNSSLYAGPILSYTSSVGSSSFHDKAATGDINLGAHLAFNTGYRLNDKFGLFGEVDMRVYKNEFMPCCENLDYNPVRTMAFRLGARYTLDGDNTLRDDSETFEVPRNYMFFGAGIQSLNADLTLSKTVGPSIAFGYGHWISRSLGYQLSGGWSSGAWARYRKNGKPFDAKMQFAFARAEFMLNAYTRVNESGRGFSVAALSGFEFGQLWRYRTTLTNQTDATYGGFTGGVRLKYHVGEGKAVYLEPRVTFAHFKDDKISLDNYSMSSRYNISLGMEYGSPYFNGVGRPEISDDFEPRTSVMLMAGPSYVANRGAYNGTPYSSYLSYSAAIGVEYQPFRLFGARLMYDFSRYGQNSSDYAGNKWLTDVQFNVNSAILDFKLDLTNLVYGYERSRRWNSSLYAGPILSYTSSVGSSSFHDKAATGDINLGAHLAFNTGYRLNDKFGLFGEVDMRVYKNEFMPYCENLDYNPVRTMAFRLGARYTLDGDNTLRDDSETFEVPRNYMFFGAGIQSLNADLTLFKTVGPSIAFGYGHWISRSLGYQLSGGWSSGAWARYRKNGKPFDAKMQFAFARAEFMLNAYTRVNESGRGFSVAALSGFEFGQLWRYRTTLTNQTDATYGGFTGGVRLKYHVGEGKAVYLEPRVTFAHFKDDKISLDNYSMSSRYNISLGMEYGSPYFNGVGRPEISDEFIPRTSVMLMAGPSYVANRGAYNGTPYSSYLSYSAAIGVEYQPFRLFGARLMYDFSRYGQNSSDYAGNKWLTDFQFNVNSAILDFKLDLTNLVYGYERSRRWNSSLYAGPILSYTSSVGSSSFHDKVATGDINLGAHLAFNTGYRLNDKFGLFGEVDMRVYKNEFMPCCENLDYNPVRTMAFRLGLSYNLK